MFTNGFGHFQHVFQIGGAVFVTGCAHGNKLEQTVLHRFLGIRGEMQASGFFIAAH